MDARAVLLLVDDDSSAADSLARALAASHALSKLHGISIDVRTAFNETSAIVLAEKFRPACAVIDLCLETKEGVAGGFRLLKSILDRDPTCRVIVLTGHADAEHGVRALNSGAASFLEKPADIPHLAALVADGVRQARLRRSYDRLASLPESAAASMIVGQCRAWSELMAAITYASKTTQPVFITGETGTGKGLCAKAIHKMSSRAAGSFVRYQPHFASCDLVNSDLFGHVKGAFTGAAEERSGLLREAHGGTFFLDEVSELPLETQISLLGVLQDKVMRPLGSNRELEINVRLICAANQNIEECLEKGKLRSDFYHRVAHFTIHLPPLRERREDIPLLAGHILNCAVQKEDLSVTGIHESAIDLLCEHDWPGNVRQLETVIEGAAFRAQYEGRARIEARDIKLGSSPNVAAGDARSFHEQVNAFKLELIKKKMAETGGNQLRTAAELGIDRSTLRRLLSAQ
ncbi:MAG: sigma-54-dependent Fis family transcriptional regulator [Deltaproteobacteria bacterium]|nr:sigma-54-dependent Fis family transcriptional regulator [Deltaproteobacteria bacterium]